MDLTPQQQQQILSQLNRSGWTVTGQRPETASVNGPPDAYGNPSKVEQPTGNVVLVITGPNGQSDEVTVKPPAPYPGPYTPGTNDAGPYNPNPTIVKGPQNNPTNPPAVAGWADQFWYTNPDGSKTLYGRDPSDGKFKQMPGVPTEAANAGKATPSDPSKFQPIHQNPSDPNSPVIALQDPSTGERVAVPQGATKKSGTEDTIQGGTIYHIQYDDQGNPHVAGSQPAPDPSKVPDGTQTIIPSAGGWGIPAVYKNGQAVPTGAAAVALTPQAQRPPQEGDTRPNVQGGYTIQEVYKGGQWVVDTSVKPTSFVPQNPTTVSAPANQQYIVQQTPGQPGVQTTDNPNYVAGDVAGRVSQLQQSAIKQRDTLNAQVASGQKTPQQAASEFDTWWSANVDPYAQQLQQQQALGQQKAQQDAEANQRANLATAQSAGQTAVSNVMAILPNMHSQKFLDQYAAALKGVATSNPSAVNFTPDAFGMPAPDLNAIAQDATAKALAHISPTAASIAGQGMPQIPQGVDIASALNKTNYAPTTTIAPDGTVTIQHSPNPTTPAAQPNFAAASINDPSRGPGMLPPLAPNELQMFGSYLPPS